MFLVVVPALQTFFLRREAGPETEPPAAAAEEPLPHT
jgi:hypothetical protein